MIKQRIFPESNYKAIHCNHKTMRIALDSSKPITELTYPEFLDVDIFETNNGKCRAACAWCYLNGNENGKYVDDAVDRIKSYFGGMSDNEKPFQVALPGSGEIFEHPDWCNILESFYDLGITPNYTTNGMWADKLDSESDEEFTDRVFNVLESTNKFCGGVAVSCHKHIRDSWESAAINYYNYGIKLNFHIIISDKQSVDYFFEIYDKWKDKVDDFVLLPHGVQGRAKEKVIEWDYLVSKMPEDVKQIAFGANFYPYLNDGKNRFNISLYEPESMSGFLSLSDMKLYKSSFNLIEKFK